MVRIVTFVTLAFGWLVFFMLLMKNGPGPCVRGADVCAFEAFEQNPPDASGDAAAAIAGMQDPVVRSAAVNRWLSVHPRASPEEGGRLCGLLSSIEQRSCLRRVNSPHLRR